MASEKQVYMHNNIGKKDALSAAMKLCSREERCVSDVKEKLEKWGLPDHDMQEVIDHLVKNNYIDEVRYATSFVNDKFRFNKWGRIKLKQALKIKELPEDAINEALLNFDEIEYLKILKEEMQKKLRSITLGNEFEKKAKLFRFAASRGFENDFVYKVMDEIF